MMFVVKDRQTWQDAQLPFETNNLRQAKQSCRMSTMLPCSCCCSQFFRQHFISRQSLSVYLLSLLSNAILLRKDLDDYWMPTCKVHLVATDLVSARLVRCCHDKKLSSLLRLINQKMLLYVASVALFVGKERLAVVNLSGNISSGAKVLGFFLFVWSNHVISLVCNPHFRFQLQPRIPYVLINLN